MCDTVLGNKVTKMHEKILLSFLMTQNIMWQIHHNLFY